jgi:hypothetical protein
MSRLLDYNAMMEDALRGVVREALARVAKAGLPGNHHFYITFRTDRPGVELAEYLRARYPEEMTIVLQHQFWGLEVGETAFSVSLSFNKVPERLTVPYGAVTAFADPSVQFGLQFRAAPAAAGAVPAERPAPAVAEAAGEAGKKGGEVVTLDAFRKK